MLHTDGLLSLRSRPLFLPDAGAPAADGIPTLDLARRLVVFPEANTRVQTMLTAFERLAARGVTGASLGEALDRRTEREPTCAPRPSFPGAAGVGTRA